MQKWHEPSRHTNAPPSILGVGAFYCSLIRAGSYLPMQVGGIVVV
nr:MAG TPA: hypothetical protein [Caudoviricetes sp.]